LPERKDGALLTATYADRLTLRAARQQYFDRNGFADGGYTARWVKLAAGPFRLYFPNTAARVRAVKLHDLHHVLTEYDTTWTGEAEIAAWELASGCRRYYAAWLLNLNAMAIGLAIAPGALYRSWVRGRASGNLYAGVFRDELLEQTVGAARHDLRLDRLPPASSRAVSFVAGAVVATVSLLAPLALVLAAAAAGLRWLGS
jgi:hypothetical protein